MSEDGEGRLPGSRPPADPPAAPSSVTDDSLLRAAMEISEPSPSEAEAYAAGGMRGDFAPGTVVAKRYRLDRELGRGGMGVVWEATHLVTRRRVAIKFVMGPAHQRAVLRRRFLREARAASAANHPNVVEVLDVFELDDGTPVMVMELLSGETLRARLLREHRLPREATATVLLPVVAAVGAAHALGIVHRDLKPENIFLLAGREPGSDVKVLDFGVAKLIVREGEASETDSLTGTGSALGTPCYMAPEQTTAEKDVDARADIWALGVIVYECLAGARPVEGSGIGQVVMKLMTEGIKPLEQVASNLPPEVTALVMRMLARVRSERPQDLREVQRVLARFTGVKPRPFGEPGALPSRDGDDRASAIPQLRAPVVDTQSPQSIPNGVRRAAPRSVLVAGTAGAVLLTAFVGWRASLPARSASTGQGLAVDAPSVAPPAASLASLLPAQVDAAVAAPLASSASVVAPPAPVSFSATRPPRVDPPRSGPAKVSIAGSASSKASETPAVPSPPVPATARPNPGGLAEKPPF